MVDSGTPKLRVRHAAAETGTELTRHGRSPCHADNDGDGIRNVDENRLGNDPKDPASVFRILGATRSRDNSA
jgi:hypothetical protein